MIKIFRTMRSYSFICRNISLHHSLCNSENPEGTKPKRKIRETVELITLVDQNEKILGLKPKSDSEKLAKKLNLALERVYDTKFGKVYPAYKLVSNTELLKVETKKSGAKALKKLPLNARISDHDLKVKLQIVQRWISKSCEVHVAISSNGDISSMKNVFKKIQEEFKDVCKIIDIREKEGVTKFIMLPPKQTKTKDSTNSNLRPDKQLLNNEKPVA